MAMSELSSASADNKVDQGLASCMVIAWPREVPAHLEAAHKQDVPR